MAGAARFEIVMEVLAGPTVLAEAIDRISKRTAESGWTTYGSTGSVAAGFFSLFGQRQWNTVKFIMTKVNGSALGARTALLGAVTIEALDFRNFQATQKEFQDIVVKPTAKEFVETFKDPLGAPVIPTWIKVTVIGGVAVFALAKIAEISRVFR